MRSTRRWERFTVTDKQRVYTISLGWFLANISVLAAIGGWAYSEVKGMQMTMKRDVLLELSKDPAVQQFYASQVNGLSEAVSIHLNHQLVSG